MELPSVSGSNLDSDSDSDLDPFFPPKITKISLTAYTKSFGDLLPGLRLTHKMLVVVM